MSNQDIPATCGHAVRFQIPADIEFRTWRCAVCVINDRDAALAAKKKQIADLAQAVVGLAEALEWVKQDCEVCHFDCEGCNDEYDMKETDLYDRTIEALILHAPAIQKAKEIAK